MGSTFLRSVKPGYAMDVSTQVTFRPASAEDFEFCKRLYFEGMQRVIDELKMDNDAQVAGFEQQWELTQVRILVVDGSDTGWMQSIMREEELFLAQIYVDGPFQRRGIGTQAMNHLLAEAAGAGRA